MKTRKNKKKFGRKLWVYAVIIFLSVGILSGWSIFVKQGIEVEENKTVQKVIDLINNPELYDGSIVIVEGNMTNLSVIDIPPWVTGYLDDGSGKIYIQGPLLMVFPSELESNVTQGVYDKLSKHIVLIKGRFYAINAPRQPNIGPLVIALRIDIKIDDKYEQVLVLLPEHV